MDSPRRGSSGPRRHILSRVALLLVLSASLGATASAAAKDYVPTAAFTKQWKAARSDLAKCNVKRAVERFKPLLDRGFRLADPGDRTRFYYGAARSYYDSGARKTGTRYAKRWIKWANDGHQQDPEVQSGPMALTLSDMSVGIYEAKCRAGRAARQRASAAAAFTTYKSEGCGKRVKKRDKQTWACTTIRVPPSAPAGGTAVVTFDFKIRHDLKRVRLCFHNINGYTNRGCAYKRSYARLASGRTIKKTLTLDVPDVPKSGRYYIDNTTRAQGAGGWYANSRVCIITPEQPDSDCGGAGGSSPRARAAWKPSDYKYDPPIRFFSPKYRKGDLASRRCDFKAAYHYLSRRGIRTKGLKLKNPEQRMYFIRALSVAYFATGRKKTAKRYALMAEPMWDMPTGETDPRGNPETFGGKHQSDTIWSAFDETQSVKFASWQPSDLRYDQDAKGCHGPFSF